MKKVNKIYFRNAIKAGVVKRSMKTFIVSLFFLIVSSGCGSSLLAQDLIILKSGDEIKSVVTEVSVDLIKYKKFENQTGPVYSIEKVKVFMIKYANGSKDVFTEQQEAKVETVPRVADASAGSLSSPPQPLKVKGKKVMLNDSTLSDNRVKSIMAINPNALRSYNSGQSLCEWGAAFGGGAILYAGIILLMERKSPKAARDNALSIMYRIAATEIVVDIVLVSIGKSKIRSSVNQYNSGINKPFTYKLDFGVQENGVGFALRF